MEYQENECSEALGRLNQELINVRKTKEYRLGKKISIVTELLKKGHFSEFLGLIKLSLSRKNSLIKSELSADSHTYKQDYQGRVAVYTCIIGMNEMIKNPFFISQNCDYFIFTDMDIPRESVWKKIDIRTLLLPCENANEINRYIKIHPYKLFKEYEYSLYIDGNIEIVTDVLPMINEMSKDEIIALHSHDRRVCAYKEAETFFDIPRLNKFAKEANKQMMEYKRQGFPANYGLFENSIIIRKHNDLECQNAMNLWWEQLIKYTMRDQISLPYVFWKCKISKMKIHILGTNLRENYRFIQREH